MSARFKFVSAQPAGEGAMIVMVEYVCYTDEQRGMQAYDELQSFIAQGCRRMLLNMQGVTGIYSRFLGHLVNLHRQLIALGGSLTVCGVEPKVKFAVSSLEKHGIAILDMEQEAVGASPA